MSNRLEGSRIGDKERGGLNGRKQAEEGILSYKG